MKKSSRSCGFGLSRANSQSGNVGVATILVIVIILAIIGYFYFNKTASAPSGPVNQDTASLGGTVAGAVTGSQDIAGKVAPETNPFKAAEVNPFTDVYKNPFGTN